MSNTWCDTPKTSASARSSPQPAHTVWVCTIRRRHRHRAAHPGLIDHDEELTAMSIYPLMLPGWEDLSTWGAEDDYLYAQVTRNGNSDDSDPEFWITPHLHPICRTVPELSQAISLVTGVDLPNVLDAMAFGVGPEARRLLGLPSNERPGPPGRV